MGPWDLSAALSQHPASPHPSRHRPRTLPSPSAQAARLGLGSLALTASSQARPGASASCSHAPLIPASSHSVLQRPDCVHPCPACSQESGRDPQLVNQSPQAGWLPRCAGSSERQRLKHPWGWGVRPRVRDRRRRPGRATYVRAGAGGTDAKLGAETDRHGEEDCRMRQ